MCVKVLFHYVIIKIIENCDCLGNWQGNGASMEIMIQMSRVGARTFFIYMKDIQKKS